MTTYPLATLAPTIDSTGISAPPYSDIYQSLIASFQLIYGNDIIITPDSQDGQLLAVFANAIHESNQAVVAMFNSFSPTFAVGAGLSARVKINGLVRGIATNSTAVIDVTGVAGTTIINGVVQDIDGNLWNLPTPLVIPIGGVVTTTATAQDLGALEAAVGTITKIYNPQIGWQTVTNTSAATPGMPIETDAELRARQAVSTSLPALGILPAILSAIGNVPGVGRYTAYENDTNATDSNGLPPHSFSVVAEGGTTAEIGIAIQGRKPPGIQTYGTTSVVVTDSIGLPSTINYFVLSIKPVYLDITIQALTGYISTTADEIKAALAAYLNGLDIGEDVYVEQAKAVASLMSTTLGKTFKITAFALGFAPAPVGTADLVVAFNEAASGDVADFAITTV